MSNSLQILIKPCVSGSCPALYKDEQGRIFIQGSKLIADTRESISVSEDEEVVEISPDLLDYLRSTQA